MYPDYAYERQLKTCANYGELNEAKEERKKTKITTSTSSNVDISHSYPNDKKIKKDEKPLVDFFIAGFPKCGTTSLLEAFRWHPEAAIGEEEFCEMRNATLTSEQLLGLLEQEMSSLHTNNNMNGTTAGTNTNNNNIRGIKCPMSIRDIHAIQRVASLSPNVKLIIGVRHPIWFFQSFYNYRISYMYLENEENIDYKIPPPACLLDVPWREVSADLLQYELSLQQLSKTKLSIAQRKELNRQGRTVLPPNKIQIFLYSMEQLGDDDVQRSQTFRKDLQTFLNLTLPFQGNFPAENKLKDLFTKKRRKKFHPPQHLDICSSEHAKLRTILIERAKRTKQWIIEEFGKSEDVTIGGKDHFFQLLDEWSKNPCYY